MDQREPQTATDGSIGAQQEVTGITNQARSVGAVQHLARPPPPLPARPLTSLRDVSTHRQLFVSTCHTQKTLTTALLARPISKRNRTTPAERKQDILLTASPSEAPVNARFFLHLPPPTRLKLQCNRTSACSFVARLAEILFALDAIRA